VALGIEEKLIEGHRRRPEEPVLVGLVPGEQLAPGRIAVGRVGTGERGHLLDDTAPDHPVVAIQPAGHPFAEQDLLAQEPLQQIGELGGVRLALPGRPKGRPQSVDVGAGDVDAVRHRGRGHGGGGAGRLAALPRQVPERENQRAQRNEMRHRFPEQPHSARGYSGRCRLVCPLRTTAAFFARLGCRSPPPLR
jgi:hypothetical protein